MEVEFMYMNTKFCRMSTKFGTVNLILFRSTSLLFDDLCNILIVPKEENWPNLQLVYSSQHSKIFALASKKNRITSLLPISPIMDELDHSIIELDLLDFSDISEIQQITKEAIKWKDLWEDRIFEIDYRDAFLPDLSNTDYLD